MASNSAKGCVKLRRCKKLESMYKAQFFRTEKNQKKRFQRHLRAHPHDEAARAVYLQKHGPLTLGLTSRGRKLVERAERSTRQLNLKEAASA